MCPAAFLGLKTGLDGLGRYKLHLKRIPRSTSSIHLATESSCNGGPVPSGLLFAQEAALNPNFHAFWCAYP